MKYLTMLLLGGVLMLAACATPEVTTAPDEAASDVAATEPVAPASTPEPEPTETARVGSTISLTGNDEGAEVAVKVVEVIDGAAAANEFFQAEAGNKFIAVRVELSNTGQAVYSDAPRNGALLLNAANEQFTATIAEVQGCQEFAGGGVTLPPGSTALGCLTFELPADATAARFQFTLDSGFGPETGIWELA